MKKRALDDAATSRPVWVIGGVILLLAALYRLYLMTSAFAHIDGDQAVVGVMAYHIQQGDRPVFYYGQPYTASVEAYLAAVFCAVLGATEFVVRLPAFLFSVAFVGVTYYLGVLLYGLRVAALAGVFLALGPGLLINWSTAAGANYSEAVTLGTVLLIGVLHYPDPWRLPWRIALLGGVLAGLGLWMQPMIGEYLLPIIAVYLLRLWRGRRDEHRAGTVRGLAQTTAALVVGLVVGLLPLLVYNVQHHGQTLRYLLRMGGGGDHLAVAGRFVAQSVPIVLGLGIPTNEYQVNSDFLRMAALHPWLYVAGLVLGCGLLALYVVRASRSFFRLVARRSWRGAPRKPVQRPWARPGHTPDDIVVLFVVCPLIFFVMTGYGAGATATSRPCYLLPLYTATPLFIDMLRGRGRRAGAVATATVGLLIAAGALATQLTPVRSSITGLDHLLEARGIQAVYANDYWLVYRLAFASHERVRAVGVDDQMHYGLTRTPAYVTAAARMAAPHVAWVFYTGRPAGERTFRRYLLRHHVTACRIPWRNRVIYACLSAPIRGRGQFFTHGQQG